MYILAALYYSICFVFFFFHFKFVFLSAVLIGQFPLFYFANHLFILLH